MKKIFLLLLTCCMLAGTFSCAAGGETTENTSALTEAVTEAETLLSDNLPEQDYGGESFRIAIGEHAKQDFVAEGETGETLNDAVYSRNIAVEERFNVSFDMVYEIGVYNSVRTAITANDDSYDICDDMYQVVIPMATDGLLIDMKTLDYIDFTKPWWDSNVERDICYGDKIFYAAGDFNTSTMGMSCIVLFNKNLFDSLSISYPYQLAIDGKWTYDSFYDILKQGVSDLNGDGKINYTDDRYGYVGWQYEIGPNLFESMGGRYVTKDEENMPALALGNEFTYGLFDKILNIFIGENGGWQNSVGWGPDMDVFKDSRALMLDSRFTLLNYFRDMEDDFGILPHPKLDEAQIEYYQLVSNVGNLDCIPITNNRLEMTSVILEALASESYRNVMPQYFEVLLQVKYTRDDESAEMLSIVKKSARFDLSLSAVNSSTIMTMINNGENNFASQYAKVEKAAQKELDKMIETLRGSN